MYKALGTFKQITELVDVRQSGASATAVSITSTPPTVGSPRAAARTTWNITGGNSMASAIASNPSAPVTPACSPSAIPGRVTVRRQARTKRNLSAGSVLQLSATHRLSPRQRVLFVEDNERVVYSVSRMLALEQFEVQPALDGKTALELVHQHNFDVILLDLVLPDQTGIDVLRRLRFEGNWTPAVILTGRGDFGSAKVLRLYPPYYSQFMKQSIPWYAGVDPGFATLDADNARQLPEITVRLESGDGLFIPVGWWHAVSAESVTLSLNFHDFRVPNEYPYL